MSDNLDRYGELWSRDELTIVFELYCRIPFRKTRQSNPKVIELANLLGRSPAAVARKLGNFGSFDPVLKKRDISGLTHTSKLDREVWDAFHDNWAELVVTASELRDSLEQSAQAKPKEFKPPAGPSEQLRVSRQRLHQSFFREAVLSSYEERCCVTGLAINETLIASHIVPWSANEALRADPTNGICLSATFDRLFDSGLMAIDENLSICFSGRLLEISKGPVVELVTSYHGRSLLRPTRFSPRMESIQWHRENVFSP